VIYNGVDLAEFSPQGPGERPSNRWRLLVVEGRMAGGYETGLDMAVQLARRLSAALPGKIELAIAGKVDEALRQKYASSAAFPVNFFGEVARDAIPALDRSAHLLFSADLNPACPNSVIEALACGLPVLAFDTGALPELITGDAGRVVPYGGDPWRLDPPDYEALAQSGLEILADQERFRPAARHRAEEAFGLDKMVEAYLEFLLK
jgi:glycosyltransferase involved in cell wall biosynthesis